MIVAEPIGNEILDGADLQAVALRKGETELKDSLNAAIKAIRSNGVYETVSKKYFDFDVYGK